MTRDIPPHRCRTHQVNQEQTGTEKERRHVRVLLGCYAMTSPDHDDEDFEEVPIKLWS